MLLYTLLACAGNPDTDKFPDTGDTSVEPCDLTYAPSITDGATSIPGNQTIRVVLSEPDATATLTGSVPGTSGVSTDGLTLEWTPSPPVDPLTHVDITLTTCAGSTTLGYETADMGGPLGGGVDLSASGFVVELDSGTILAPAGGEALIAILTGQGTQLLLGMDSPAAGTLDYRVAIASGGTQDLCSRTLDVAGGSLDRGWFSFGPDGATFALYDAEVVIQDLAFGGAIRPDGSGVDAAWLSGAAEVEGLAATYAKGDLDEACSFFGKLGAPCEPCPESDGQCLLLEIEGLTGTATGEPVQAVTEACPT